MEHTGFFASKQNQTLGSLALLMLIVALAAYTYLTWNEAKYADGEYPANITVQGEGEVLAVPDIGQFSFSVEAEGETASEAQEASGTAINEILAYLQEAGIEDKDIKTQNYNLYPNYRWEEPVCLPGTICRGGEQVQDGFRVNQMVSVKVRDTETAPGIISGIGERGATNISGLNFTVDDTDALQAEARAMAITDAKEKAQVLADDLGVRLVRIVGFNEGGGYYDPYYAERSMMSVGLSEDSGFGGASLPTGENSTKVNVSITYEVR